MHAKTSAASFKFVSLTHVERDHIPFLFKGIFDLLKGAYRIVCARRGHKRSKERAIMKDHKDTKSISRMYVTC